MTGNATTGFATQTCTAPANRSDRMRDIVLQHAASNRPLRVLDLGCGTGSLVSRLADAMPSASITGIDVSPANIAAAERRMAPASGSRVQFAVADYLSFNDPPFDLIVCDGVLHLITASTDALVRKLSADLTSEGLLICDMPYDCVYNQIFSAVRRLLRAMRSPITDRAILAVGRLLHARDMDVAGLRERVGYMYIPPERVMGRTLAHSFDAAGLHRIATHPMPSTSLSQLRHNVTVWSKAAPTA